MYCPAIYPIALFYFIFICLSDGGEGQPLDIDAVTRSFEPIFDLWKDDLLSPETPITIFIGGCSTCEEAISHVLYWRIRGRDNLHIIACDIE